MNLEIVIEIQKLMVAQERKIDYRRILIIALSLVWSTRTLNLDTIFIFLLI